jgi:hypothetical protein
MELYKNSEKGHAPKAVEKAVDLGKKKHDFLEEAKFRLNNPIDVDELE